MTHDELPDLASELLTAALIYGDANTTGLTGDLRERVMLTDHGALVVSKP